MAAFHFTAKLHSRSGGRNAVRAAAYRAGEWLWNERDGKGEDYSRKTDVIDCAILTPPGSPAWARDREDLWNRVEARERRKDAQVAQELELNLPRELTDAENWRLVTDFARAHLVAPEGVPGRICDIAMHRHIASDGESHPHAHILMPTRVLEGETFGEKHPDCSWKTFKGPRDRIVELRETWCAFARQRALDLGIDLGPGWDHRSFADRDLNLEAQPKWGATAQRLEQQRAAAGMNGMSGTPAERTAELLATQRRNGARLLLDPGLAIAALTSQHATFSQVELARYIFTHSAPEQYEAALAGAQALAVSVGFDAKGIERFSSADLIALEARMVENAAAMAATPGHRVAPSERKLMRAGLSPEQRDAAAILLGGGDLSCLVGYAGAGKSTMLGEVRAELEAAGYTVRGAALSGIAAQNLADGSGIEARTLASLRYAWRQGKDRLTERDVLVIDEAGMIGSRELAGMIEAARTAGAKVILVGDPQQLQAIESGAAFRAIAERTGYAELTEVRRQRAEWQRAATRDLATGHTIEAIRSYADAGRVEQAGADVEAKALLVARWQAARQLVPEASRIMLAHSRADVRALNEEARWVRKEAGELGGMDGPEQEIETSRGTRAFAAGDRLLFRRNERTLGVRNGTLGTVIALEDGQLYVRTDAGKTVMVDPAAYADFDHGYAVTVHKSQGVTVDEAYVLASRGFDRHLTYVACSRHRDRLTLVYSGESFGSEAQLLNTLARERAKDTTLDYREESPPPDLSLGTPSRADKRSTQTAPPDLSETEQMFAAWAERSATPERQWEWRTRDRGWGL